MKFGPRSRSFHPVYVSLGLVLVGKGTRFSYPLASDNTSGEDQQADAGNERRLACPRDGDEPLAGNTAHDCDHTVDGAHEPERPGQVKALAAEAAVVEVGDHPALEDAEEQTGAETPEDATEEEKRQARDGGEQAREGVGGAEEEAARLAAVAVRQGADEVAAHSARDEACGEERRHEVGGDAVLILVERVEEWALGGGVNNWAYWRVSDEADEEALTWSQSEPMTRA